MKKLIAAFIGAFLIPSLAFGQGALIQGGPTTPGHVPMYNTQGTGQAVVQDSGGAGAGGPGVGLSELGIVARGTGAAPYSGQGTGPLGTNVCDYDAPTTSANGYHYLCFSANATGGQTAIVIGAGGGASNLPVNFVINGTSYPFPGSLSGIVIGTTAVSGGVNGQCLYNNAGVVGGQACSSNLVVGTTTISSGTPNGILFNSAGLLGNLASGNNGVLITSAGGVPSISSTLPSALTIPNPTLSGTVAASGTVTASGVWNFTGTFESSGVAQTFPTSGIIVGTTDTQTFNNKTFDTAAGNVLRINGTGISAVTGTGAAVLAVGPSISSPILTTPNLGAATAASINRVIITPPASSATLTLADGKTFTVSNTLTLAGTDSTVMTFPGSSDTVVTLGATQTLTNKTLTAPTINNAVVISAGTNGSVGGAVVLNGATSGAVTVSVPAGAGSTTFRLPNTNGTAGQLLQTDGSGNTSWLTATGTGTLTSLSAGAGLSTGTGAAITTTGTLYAIRAPEGRLTLVTGVPVMVSNQTAKATVYYDCYNGGSRVPYYNGTDNLAETISGCEVSTAMVSAASAGQVVSGQVYDMWWVHSGANRICLAMSAAAGGGGGWASDTAGSNTARGTGYSQLDLSGAVTPFISNKNAITHCFNGATDYGSVAANQGTYLGTIYATANGQTGMAYTATGSGGGGNVLGVYNGYNRLPILATSADTTSSWNYALATWRKANGNNNNAISWVDGLQQSSTFGVYNIYGVSVSADALAGCMMDWSSGAPALVAVTPASAAGPESPTCASLPLSGLHVLNAVEASTSAATVTFFGSGLPTGVQSQQLTLRVDM